METALKTRTPEKTESAVALHQLVDHLVVRFLSRTLQHKSFIINDVKREMLVGANKNMLASVISCLLNTTIAQTQDNCIRVSAKLFGNITLVLVKNNDHRHEMVIAQSLQQVQSLVEQLGGCVTITNNKINGATLAFTFSNNQLAA
jgi:hypothetical protein